jgi:hypothetical protein
VEGKDRERPLVRFGSEEQALSDPLNGHLAQSDLVTLSLLRKLDDALPYELRCRIGAINKPQFAYGFLESIR